MQAPHSPRRGAGLRRAVGRRALTALGVYSGDGSPVEHAAEAARLGERRYRLRLANALLGAAQIEAMPAETLSSGPEDLAAAHDQQLATAGVTDDGVKGSGRRTRACSPR